MSDTYVPRPARSQSGGWLVALAALIVLLLMFGSGALVGLRFYFGTRAAEVQLQQAEMQLQRAAAAAALAEETRAAAEQTQQQQLPTPRDEEPKEQPVTPNPLP